MSMLIVGFKGERKSANEHSLSQWKLLQVRGQKRGPALEWEVPFWRFYHHAYHVHCSPLQNLLTNQDVLSLMKAFPIESSSFFSNNCFWSVARRHHICPFLRHAYYHWFKSAYLSIRGLSSWFCFLRVVEPLDFHHHIAATPLPHALDPTNIRKIEIFCWIGHENCAITDLSMNSSHFVIQRYVSTS